MIPLRDYNPTSKFPIITVLLILVNIVVFVVQPPQDKPFYEMIPADVTSGHSFVGLIHQSSDGNLHFTPEPLEAVENRSYDSQNVVPVLPTVQPVWVSIFTAMFLHANFLHIAGNMLFLWIFGNNVEDAMGRLRYLLFYFGCGLVAALAQIIVDPHSLIPTLGASGAIAGVLGAYLILFPDARVLTLFTVGLIFLRDVSAFWSIGFWIALQIFEGVTGLGGASTGGVAYFAHIGGAICGIFLTLLMGGRALGDRALRAVASPRYRQR